jgi:hypothetical protein
MSKKDAVVLAGRTLATLLIVWALTEVSHLPGTLQSYLHYVNHELSSPSVEYMRHYYLIILGFTVTRIVGFSLMARWLYRGGREIEELLLPAEPEESPVRD